MNTAVTDRQGGIEQTKGALQRKEFSAVETVEARHETAATAVAAQSKAMVEARYVMAMRNRRVWDQVRQDLMNECRRPSFAQNKSALYHKPIGRDGVEGLGIRFVEVALRCMTNVVAESAMIYSDDRNEIHRVTVTDLEGNVTWPMDVTVSRTVERAKPMDDGSYISVRMNSYGKPSYTIPATDDELLNKRLALISKALRTAGLRVIPGDLQDEAEEIIRKIRLDKAAQDPAAERNKIADAFNGLGVKVTDLQEYLGHGLDTCTPAELVELRGLYGALRDGEATWKTAMESKAASGGEEKKSEPKAARGVEGAKERAEAKAGNTDATKTLAEVKAKCAEAVAANNEISHDLIADAAGLAATLTGDQKTEADAAIAQAKGALAPKKDPPKGQPSPAEIVATVKQLCDQAVGITDLETARAKLSEAKDWARDKSLKGADKSNADLAVSTAEEEIDKRDPAKQKQ